VRRWRSGPPLDDNGIASLARVYDITVVGRPRSSLSGPRMMSLEAVLFDSGRPILIAPPRSFGVAPLGEAITIAWNCSTETARTVALAMRLLKQAREVSVLTIEGVEVPGPSGEALAECLKLNGIKVTAVTRPQRDRKPGLAMLEEAAALGADLVVKGAYTQSRLRQMIFGGATSQILAHTELPVFMAH
jgi:nucleotide-binding universal stress UspA family protein